MFLFRNRGTASALCAAIAVASLTFVPTAAHASLIAMEEVSLSPDSPSMEHEFSGLLSGNVVVPRDTAVDDFTVHNASSERGYLRLVLADVAVTDPIMRDALFVTLSADDSMSEAVPLGAAVPCRQLLSTIPLEPGERVDVSAALSMADVTGLLAQDESVTFTLQVMLSGAPVDDATACADNAQDSTHDRSTLAQTGWALSMGLLVAAAALIGAGSAVFTARRRGGHQREAATRGAS